MRLFAWQWCIVLGHFVILSCNPRLTEGTSCSDDQVQECKAAAGRNDLQLISAGGTCSPNKYVGYTHLCALRGYLPADYCCCVAKDSVLCCRYRQDQNNYRCSLTEDEIDTRPRLHFLHQLADLQWYWWLLSGLALLLLLVSTVYYVCKCCCTQYDEDANKVNFQPCCCKYRERKNSDSCQYSPNMEILHGPVQTQSSKESCDSERNLLSPYQCTDSVPTAPPFLPNLEVYTALSSTSDGVQSTDSSTLEYIQTLGPPPGYSEHYKDRKLEV